mmetsp:Transcript_1860/g.1792  ORF Transcript_1860/g.1792 Transcript_1860/m.1792 type:complete len:93 (-) Transcript_1860:624-902(-)
MALNPPQMADGEPVRVAGEYFMLKRKGIEFECKVKGEGKFKGVGYLVLTTCRLVLINTKSKSKFNAFDLPLAHIFSESFKQPIFGANYEKGM